MKPAFYALRPGGGRDYVSLLHVPYTLWHLSYVAIGACLAPVVDWSLLGWTLAAFALALGVAAHALDELRGRPLGTRIPSWALGGLAMSSLAAASAIGIAFAVDTTLWLLAFVAAGAFLVLAYNLELAGGLFHSDLWFGLAWGGFPVLTAYFAQAERLRWEALLAAAFAVLLSLAQRRLSTPVRLVRRRVTEVSGTIELSDGTREPVTAALLIAAPERALQALTAATVALAAALVVLRL
ncbi:MAG: hypothetical protein HY511_06110 [Actinobacteria bacterium]|nr:hypothetical protein [Actinomycetota bacterium]